MGLRRLSGIPDAAGTTYSWFMIDEKPIRARYQAVRASLDERGRRLHAAAEAVAAGHGGIAAISRATKVARSTIGRGLKDLREPGSLTGKVRRQGAGRPTVTAKDPTLLDDLRPAARTGDNGRSDAPIAVGFQKSRQAGDDVAQVGPQGEHVEHAEAVGAVGVPPPQPAPAKAGVNRKTKDAAITLTATHNSSTSMPRHESSTPPVSR